ncbi:MAG TPA: UdgX family uracil-DNA binding protein [Candidatus Sulfotelmatobacter sp.]|nr:UdgX family uracil-DNA binding protein [Candidatus Sulfotelmatobacter sp.]
MTARRIRRSRGSGTKSSSRAHLRTPADFIPASPTLTTLQMAAHKCKSCDLWRNATQTVFGEGPTPARVMFVGEQPGDSEDKSGHPFVGPAGKLLDEVLVEVGIDRSEVFVTNVVKHFKWVAAQRGKRRIHKKPRQSEIEACRPWLDAELQLVRPEVLVCLGASAAQALLGKNFRVTRERGILVKSNLAPYVMATTHPASILRAPDSEAREQQRREFVRDLKKVADLIHAGRTSAA